MAETKLSLKQLEEIGANDGQVLFYTQYGWSSGSAYTPHVIRAGVSQGKPEANIEFARYKVGADVYVTTTGYGGNPALSGTCRINPTAAAIITVKRNEAAYATCTFNTNGTTTIAWQGSDWNLAPADVLSFHTPVTQDATLLDFGVTLVGKVPVIM